MACANIIAVTGIGPIGRVVYQPGADGVEVDVASEMSQISVAVYMFGFERALIERTDALLLTVDGFDVGCAKGLHDFITDILPAQMDKKVIMIGHQAVSQNDDKVGGEVSAHSLDEEAPVIFVEEDRLAVDAPIVEVVIVAG